MSRLYTRSRLDPQMVVAMDKEAELAPGIGDVSQLSVQEIRKLYTQAREYWNADAPALPTVINKTVPGPVGDIPIRLYYPAEKRPLPGLIYLHGGGWVLGNLDTHDKIMRLFALQSGVAVIGVDYHLAPEYKFPVAIEETITITHHLRRCGNDLGIDASRIAMGGDSAGANISMAASLVLRASYPDLLKYLLLYYGIYGLKDSRTRRLYGGPEDGMGEDDLEFYQDCYLRTEEDQNDPRYSILKADLKGLPPAFIGAAEFDPLLDDSLTLRTLLDEAGIANEFKVYGGVLHSFLHYSRVVDKAVQAIEHGTAALRAAFSQR